MTTKEKALQAYIEHLIGCYSKIASGPSTDCLKNLDSYFSVKLLKRIVYIQIIDSLK